MNLNGELSQSENSRVLLFSNRNIYEPLVWRCPFQEFERILQEVDSVDLLAPKPTNWYPHGRRVAMRLGEFVNVPLNPGLPPITVDRDYDLFITVPERVGELLHLQSLKGWKDRCKKTICWLPEFYAKDIPLYKSCV